MSKIITLYINKTLLSKLESHPMREHFPTMGKFVIDLLEKQTNTADSSRLSLQNQELLAWCVEDYRKNIEDTGCYTPLEISQMLADYKRIETEKLLRLTPAVKRDKI